MRKGFYDKHSQHSVRERGHTLTTHSLPIVIRSHNIKTKKELMRSLPYCRSGATSASSRSYFLFLPMKFFSQMCTSAMHSAQICRYRLNIWPGNFSSTIIKIFVDPVPLVVYRGVGQLDKCTRARLEIKSGDQSLYQQTDGHICSLLFFKDQREEGGFNNAVHIRPRCS